MAGRARDEEVELALAEPAVAEAGERVREALGLRRARVAAALDGERARHRGEQLGGMHGVGQAGVRAGAQQAGALARRHRAAEDDHGRDRQAIAALERGEDRRAGGGAHRHDDVGRRAERRRRQPRLDVVALGGQRAHERLVPALRDDEDAPAGLGSGLHGRRVYGVNFTVMTSPSAIT